jgi:hypothetical protein
MHTQTFAKYMDANIHIFVQLKKNNLKKQLIFPLFNHQICILANIISKFTCINIKKSSQ